MKRTLIAGALCIALLIAGCAAPLPAAPTQPAAQAPAEQAPAAQAPAEQAPAAQAPAEQAPAAQAPATPQPPENVPVEPDMQPVADIEAPAADPAAEQGMQKSIADYDYEALAAQTADVVRTVDAADPTGNAQQDRERFRELDRALEQMEDILDRVEDDAEYDYRQGLLSRADYRTLEYDIEGLEDELEYAEDSLEYRFRMD